MLVRDVLNMVDENESMSMRTSKLQILNGLTCVARGVSSCQCRDVPIIRSNLFTMTSQKVKIYASKRLNERDTMVFARDYLPLLVHKLFVEKQFARNICFSDV